MVNSEINSNVLYFEFISQKEEYNSAIKGLDNKYSFIDEKTKAVDKIKIQKIKDIQKEAGINRKDKIVFYKGKPQLRRDKITDEIKAKIKAIEDEAAAHIKAVRTDYEKERLELDSRYSKSTYKDHLLKISDDNIVAQAELKRLDSIKPILVTATEKTIEQPTATPPQQTERIIAEAKQIAPQQLPASEAPTPLPGQDKLPVSKPVVDSKDRAVEAVPAITARPIVVVTAYNAHVSQIKDSDPAKAKQLMDIVKAINKGVPGNKIITLPHPAAPIADINDALQKQGIGGRSR
jgi:hypothetical protein